MARSITTWLRNWWWRARVCFRFRRKVRENRYWTPVSSPTPRMQKLVNDFNTALDKAYEEHMHRH